MLATSHDNKPMSTSDPQLEVARHTCNADKSTFKCIFFERKFVKDQLRYSVFSYQNVKIKPANNTIRPQGPKSAIPIHNSNYFLTNLVQG